MRTQPTEKIHSDAVSQMNVVLPGGKTYGSGVNSITADSNTNRRRTDFAVKNSHHRQAVTAPACLGYRLSRPDQITASRSSSVVVRAAA
jgi:hypothetical protein